MAPLEIGIFDRDPSREARVVVDANTTARMDHALGAVISTVSLDDTRALVQVEPNVQIEVNQVSFGPEGVEKVGPTSYLLKNGESIMLQEEGTGLPVINIRKIEQESSSRI